jgi:hypothetical protein
MQYNIYIYIYIYSIKVINKAYYSINIFYARVIFFAIAKKIFWLWENNFQIQLLDVLLSFAQYYVSFVMLHHCVFF